MLATEARVIEEMKRGLETEFRIEEVEVALKQMSAIKSLGLDGFGAFFYQNHWETLGKETCHVVLEFLQGGDMIQELNHTHISLIPKVKTPKSVMDFRSISLFNMLYKLLSKVLVKRIKKVLHRIISPNPSAFILGRLIIDNIMVAFEVLHSMKTKQKGRTGDMTIKLDISKAYDRVECHFLEAMLRRLGFGERVIGLIVKCGSSVSYYVLVNGKPGKEILPSRDLRQVDHLSPYLFIICAEGLSQLLFKPDEGEYKGDCCYKGGYKGDCCYKEGSKINHLLFANDCDFQQSKEGRMGYYLLNP